MRTHLYSVEGWHAGMPLPRTCTLSGELEVLVEGEPEVRVRQTPSSGDIVIQVAVEEGE